MALAIWVAGQHFLGMIIWCVNTQLLYLYFFSCQPYLDQQQLLNNRFWLAQQLTLAQQLINHHKTNLCQCMSCWSIWEPHFSTPRQSRKHLYRETALEAPSLLSAAEFRLGAANPTTVQSSLSTVNPLMMNFTV